MQAQITANDGDISTLTTNLITTGQTLQTQITSNDSDISTLTSNLITTGQTLQTQITANDGDISTLTSNLITTGQTLQAQITSNDTDIATNATNIATNVTNLIATGQTLTTNINTVSTNLIATGAIVDDISGNLITTGQTLTDEIAIVSGLVTTGTVDGSGVTNYVTRWSDEDTLTSGIIYDNAQKVGISTASPQAELHVYAGATAGDSLLVESTATNAADAPDLVLYRNSSSPANSDDLGIIRFRGKNNGADTGYGRTK